MERGGKEVLVGPNLPTFTSIQINGGRQLGVIFLVVSIFFIFSFFFSLLSFSPRTNESSQVALIDPEGCGIRSCTQPSTTGRPSITRK